MDVVATSQNNAEEFGDKVPSGHPMPEQPTQLAPVPTIPRPFSFDDAIHRWAPMGIRVVVNVPFISNDSQYLFLIRHNPFIPWIGDNPLNPIYYFQNLFPVKHQPGTEAFGNIDKTAVTITQHSPPPLLSLLAACHREWRGSISYRLRAVSNFTAQGYIFATMLRNRSVIKGRVDPLHTSLIIDQADYSYSEGMYNSYTMSDLSMFRHMEISIPYEYPVPFVDQYAYMTRGVYDPKTEMPPASFVDHGDNYLAIGVRGQIAVQQGAAQLMFELEYKAGDDFQFGNRFLLPPWAFTSKATYFGGSTPLDSVATTTIMPDTKHNTDGISQIKAT